MIRLNKSERVESFLTKLTEIKNLDIEEIKDLHHHDFIHEKALEGIGERTIRNALRDFKLSKGLPESKVSLSKKEKIIEFLDEQLGEGEITIEQLENMSYGDLKRMPKFSKIGKTTLCCALSEFRSQFQSDLFEQKIFNFLNKGKKNGEEKKSAREKRSLPPKVTTSIGTADVVDIKRKAAEQKKRKDSKPLVSSNELAELMKALDYFGINADRVVKAYREFLDQRRIDQEREFSHVYSFSAEVSKYVENQWDSIS